VDNLKIFYSKILANAESLAKFNAILDENEEITDEQINKLLDLAKEVGVELTAKDIKNYLSIQDNDSEKMTEEELEMVAGGGDKPKRSRLRACFVENSKISTPSGAKFISEIKVGDEVFSLDAQNKKCVAKVIEVRPVVKEKIYKVEFSNGAIWNTTATQWFYCGRVYGNDDDYACAIDSKGKAALTEDGEKATVVKVENTGEVKKVYDFITDGINIFFVNGVAAEGYSID